MIAKKIIAQKKHRAKLLLTAIGFFIGLSLLLISLQSYLDLKTLISNPQTATGEYLIINKGVSAAQSLGGMDKSFRSSFSEEEVDFIRKKDFVKDLGKFSVSTFEISSNLADRLSIYADLFFESVPDRFLDTIHSKWGWQKGDAFVPVLLNKEWLNVYNFNVSLMYGLPQLSEKTVTELDFDVILSGNGLKKRYKARIVAFSHRMPAITVPDSFLNYANRTFGEGPPKPPRLILKVSDASSEEVQAFLQKRNYQYNREKTIPDGFQQIAEVTFSVSGLIGLLFFIFAFVIVLTTLQLSVADVSPEMKLLIQLGYEPGKLTRFLIKNALLYLSVAIVFSGVAYVIVHQVLLDLLNRQGITFTSGPDWKVIIIGTVLVIAVMLILFLGINHTIRKVAKQGD